MGIRRIQGGFSTEAKKRSGSCLVRSGTDDPCGRPVEVEIGGVPFCGACAGEQEAYFAVGELTEEPQGPHDDERLASLLVLMRRTKRGWTAPAGASDAA